MKRKILRRIVAVTAALLFIACLAVPVAAQPYDVPAATADSYNYNVYGESVPAPAFYRYERSFGENLSGATDLLVTDGRLAVLDAAGQCIRYYALDSGDETAVSVPVAEDGTALDLKDATGFFADGAQRIYIALPKQQAVSVLDADGVERLRIGVPKSSLIPKDYIYTPSRVAVQKDGLIYVVSDSSYQGLLQLSAEGEFISFFGSNTVSVTPAAILNQMWRKLFNKEQQSRMENILPADYASLDIGADDFIYTVTDTETKREIKKHSPLGNNVLGYAENVAAGVLIGQDNYGDYESYRDANTTVETAFTDLSVSDDGIIYALDSSRKRVFVYDQASNLLGEFGGSDQKQGLFTKPVSIEEYRSDVFVLDSAKGTVMKFTRTAYAENLLQAVKLYCNGEFEQAETYFAAARKQNTNLPLCADGLGWAALIRGDSRAAMSYFRESKNKTGYNQAFMAERTDFMNRNFIWVFGAFLVVLAGVFVLITQAAKKPAFDAFSPRIKKLNPLQVMCHPFNGFESMKDAKKQSFWWSVAVLAALCLSRALQIAYSGFLFNNYRLQQVNLVTEFVQLLALVAAFTLCSWAIGTLVDSEATLKEIFFATVYSLCPYIIAQLSATLFSNVLVLRESAFLTAITAIGGFLTVAELFIGIIKTHKFSFGKAVLFVVLVVVGILFLLFLFLMFYSLVGQLGSFLKSLIDEIQYRI